VRRAFSGVKSPDWIMGMNGILLGLLINTFGILMILLTLRLMTRLLIKIEKELDDRRITSER
jgi:hypothetical protein